MKKLDLKEMFAFAAIYLLWGSTFLAIRIAVLEFPPFLTAALRFGIAGAILYAVMRVRGQPRPSLTEWRGLGVIALLMFVLTYGPLFWAEQYVTSSMTSIIEATLPITTIVLEVFAFRTQSLGWRLATGVGLGFAGVVLLMVHNEAQHLALIPSLVILAAGLAWSLGAVLSGRLILPASRPLAAGAQMMLGGAGLLVASTSSGELYPLPHITPRGVYAIIYLVIFGSLIAYTAYVWLLGRYSVTQVSSHAYINPVVAMALGYFAAGDVITIRSIFASGLIVVSVFLILTGGAKREVQPTRSMTRQSVAGRE
jgi:drug/metabolite transporter (DMT)-like permease